MPDFVSSPPYWNIFYETRLYSIEQLRLGLSTTLTSEDKNGDFETSLKVKNKNYILVYDGLGANI